MNTSLSISSSVEASELLFREAYENLAAERSTLDVAELMPVSLEIPAAVATAFGALPEIRALRPAIQTIVGIDLAQIDKLEPYLLAMSYAHTLYLTAQQPADVLVKLVEEGTALRDRLEADATALARRGILGEIRPPDRRGAGYKALAVELQMLSSLLREHWSLVEGNSGVKLPELERAELVASHILRALGLREQGPSVIAASAENRMRAFTLFMRAYSEVRRAVVFLRWSQGDADDIAPSLYAGRGAGRRKAQDTPETPAPATPRVPGASPTAPVPPVAHPAEGPPSVTMTPPHTSTPSGLPGSSPFMD